MRFFILTAATSLLPVLAAAQTPTPTPALPPTPPQNEGLPYTRSSRALALTRIGDCIALFPGSRYAYVFGYKVRLDEANWKAEAALQNGKLLVPTAFGSVLAGQIPLSHLTARMELNIQPAPKYLEERWVYELPREKFKIKNATQIDGMSYCDVAAEAASRGLTVGKHPRGLVFIGAKLPNLDGLAAPHIDAIVTLFDTPEKFADPDIATRSIPSLMRQGAWTQRVKITPAVNAILNGPETKWPTVAREKYDYSGFDKTRLGSRVPPPGVYPRVLFSPEDVPGIAARVRASKTGQMALIEMEYLLRKSWWDASTSDGQIFQKLVKGDFSGLEWDVKPDTPPMSYPQQFKGQKPGIFNSHIAYVPECLSTMALFCLLTGDDEHGQQAAAAIANYYKLREPLLDEVNAISDSEFGGEYKRPDGTTLVLSGGGGGTHYRTVAGVAAHNLGLAFDFGGKWMTPEQKEIMRRVVAKTTYGRRSYGQDGPVRFRDVNWVTWDLPMFVTVASIEGLEGFDREAYAAGAETARAFCDWGIDERGVLFESNGKAPGGLQWQTLSMIALARRGENLFGHPHWRKLLQAQVQMTSPSGRVVVNSGTQYTPYSQDLLTFGFAEMRKAFYPSDRAADYLLSHVDKMPYGEGTRFWQTKDFDAAKYRAEVPKLQRLRMASPTYPGFVRSVLYCADWAPTTRGDLKLPLEFNAPTQGIFSAYSDASPDAAWLNLMVRPNHYLGAGHHHADAGQLHFSALGVDWFTQSRFGQAYDGKFYNIVQVDGRSQAENMPGIANGYQAAAKFLGASSNAQGGFASTDLTDSYSYRWLTQPPHIWPAGGADFNWQVETASPILKMFAGTARYKMRPWWANYTYSNYFPTSRAPFNPMQYVFRSAGLVRGKRPYAVIVDDAKKDDAVRLYQWQAMLSGGVWQAKYEGLSGGQMVLAYRDLDPKAKPDAPHTIIEPHDGEPLLLVCPLGQTDGTQVRAEPGPPERNGAILPYEKITIDRRAAQANFKVLLLPFRMGEALPKISFDGSKATLSWPDASDELRFGSDESRTKISVLRDGKVVLQSR